MSKLLIAFMVLILCQIVWADLSPVYTNQQAIQLSGSIGSSAEAVLFNNRLEVAEILSSSDGNWSIDSISLVDGLNHFQIRETSTPGSAKLIDVALVMVDRILPQIKVSSSPDSLSPNGNLTLTVETNEKLKTVEANLPDGSLVQFTYNYWNHHWEGFWQAPAVLSQVQNYATIVATDLAGNSTVVDTTALWQVDNSSSRPVVSDKVESEDQSDEDSVSFEKTSSKSKSQFASVPDSNDAPVIEIKPVITTYNSQVLWLDSPKSDIITIADSILVEGYSPKAKLVVINEKEQLTATDGKFFKELKLNPGKQTLIVQAININDNALFTVKRKLIRLLSFSDAKFHWASSAIEALSTLGYFPQVAGSDLFSPDSPISNAEFIVALIKSKGIPLAKLPTELSFADVTADSPYASAVETALQIGLISAASDGLFRPNSYITRAEAVATLLRYSYTDLGEPLQTVAVDVNKEHWSAPYFLAAMKLKLLPPQWGSSNELVPNRALTRAEAAYLMAQVPEIKQNIANLYSFEDEKPIAQVVQVKLAKSEQPKQVSPKQIPVVKRKPVVFPRYVDLERYPADLQQKIGWLSALGYVTGDDKKRFNPESTMTRAELAALIVQAKRLIMPTRKADVAADVDYKYWANRQIQAVLEKGYLGVDYNSYFDPEGPVSRALVVVTLGKVFNKSVDKMPEAPDSNALRSFIVEMLYSQPQISNEVKKLINDTE